MTGVDGFVIENFESKLNRLMDAYTQLSAENIALREQLTQQSVELDKVAEAGVALFVDLATSIDKWNTVFFLQNYGGIGVVMIVIMPHRMHCLKIYGYYVATII